MFELSKKRIGGFLKSNCIKIKSEVIMSENLSEKLTNCLYPNLTTEEIERFRQYLKHLNAQIGEDYINDQIKSLENAKEQLPNRQDLLPKEQLDQEFAFFSYKANSSCFQEWFEEYTRRSKFNRERAYLWKQFHELTKSLYDEYSRNSKPLYDRDLYPTMAGIDPKYPYVMELIDNLSQRLIDLRIGAAKHSQEKRWVYNDEECSHEVPDYFGTSYDRSLFRIFIIMINLMQAKHTNMADAETSVDVEDNFYKYLNGEIDNTYYY